MSQAPSRASRDCGSSAGHGLRDALRGEIGKAPTARHPRIEAEQRGQYAMIEQQGALTGTLPCRRAARSSMVSGAARRTKAASVMECVAGLEAI